MDSRLVARYIFSEIMSLVFIGVALFLSAGTLASDPRPLIKGFKP